MSVLRHNIKLPARNSRGYLLISCTLLGGLIPERFLETDVPIYTIVPVLLSGLVGAYWESTSLKRKTLLVFAASCLALFVRSFTWLLTGFNIFDRFFTALARTDWVWFRAFLFL